MDHSSDKTAANETTNNNANNIPTNPTEPENRSSIMRSSSPPPHVIDLPESSTHTNLDATNRGVGNLTTTMSYQYFLHHVNYSNFLLANPTNPAAEEEDAALSDENDPRGKVNMREWLESEAGSSASKADRLELFRQVVRLVDKEHSQGFCLMDLMPSSFEIMENGDVKYTGRILCNELFNVAKVSGNARKRGSEGEGSGGKAQKVSEKGRLVVDVKKSGYSWMASNGALMEKEWYALPKGFVNKDLLNFNVYCLGLMLFEFMSHFERLGEHYAAMVDLHQRILSPRFLTRNPKEAGVCLSLLHPEPSSRPTIREIMEHESLYELESTDPITDEDSPDDTDHDVAVMDLLVDFLASLEQQKEAEVLKMQEKIKFLDSDMENAQKAYDHLRKSSDAINTDVTESKLLDNLSQLESTYFSLRSNMELNETNGTDRTDTSVLKCREGGLGVQDRTDPTKPVTRLGALFDGISKLASVSKFELCGLLKNGNMLNSNKVVCSLCFDRDEEFIASAGVEKKIKIFEIGSFLDNDVDVQYPVLQMSNESKINCISWNTCIRNYLVSCDFDGLVQETLSYFSKITNTSLDMYIKELTILGLGRFRKTWDAGIGQRFAQYKEHQNRVWSVDFSRVDPMKFVSGGEDCSVRLWSINERNSVGVIRNQATVCGVQFSAYSSHLLAFGSADHKIYLYDLRHTKIPWCTIAGHGDAVTYVRFMDSETLVSASTDSTLKLWDLNKTNLAGLSTNACRLTFRGHTNEKNFVGMAVSDGYIATGSETNEVYAYYKSLPMPIATHKLECFDPLYRDDATNDSKHFISSVCWRTKSDMLVVGNSGGNINVIRMVT